MTTSISASVIRAALITAALLFVAFLGSQFVDGWNWSSSDFAVMGAMIFIVGLMLETIVKTAGRYRIIAAITVVILFLWLWAELAVGVFTNWGS